MIPSLEEMMPLITQRMTELNYKQEDIARLLDLDQTGISRRLSGKTKFTLPELAILLPYLGIVRRGDVEAQNLTFARVTRVVQTLAPYTQKHIAMVLRAVADDLDSSAVS